MECFARCVLRTVTTLPLLRVHAVPRVVQACGYKRSLPAVLKEMKARRKKAGPEPLRHRSVKLEWNYDAEIYAFARRLGESWSDITLRTAFVEESYVDREKKQREDLGMHSGGDDFSGDIGLAPNTQLSAAGSDLCGRYVQDYLTHAFPGLPADGVEAVKRYLLSDATLSQVSSSIGTSDLIMCADFPPVEKTLANVLMALIGGLLKDSGLERAQLFVRDFVLTQLVGKDVCELWEIPDPFERLAVVLEETGRPPAEPRLLWESGRNTLEASFCVGLYSDRQLLGYSVGETLSIAQEMAARDALRRFFGLSQNSNALPLGGKLPKLLAAEAAPQSCSTTATP
uniref:Large ribosomal subunit protein mL44 n=1 Tax=Amblyomma triste TaxID=251400 RepID=A0A023GPE7_AMBTT